MIRSFMSDQSCIIGDLPGVDHAGLVGGREAAAGAVHVGTTDDTGMTTTRNMARNKHIFRTNASGT